MTGRQEVACNFYYMRNESGRKSRVLRFVPDRSRWRGTRPPSIPWSSPSKMGGDVAKRPFRAVPSVPSKGPPPPPNSSVPGPIMPYSPQLSEFKPYRPQKSEHWGYGGVQEG
ncbi:hypothetical protein B0H10DRAFT_1945372 [Mycena sp. CBHHK59/15]|nr:hypothetical protein B0H10DRAFT_1945372 [Mycena sp. CBHHK59/15]